MASREFFLYCVTCLATGKRYIGRASARRQEGPRERWVNHLSEARLGAETPLHRAIRKYGVDVFRVDHIASAISWAAAGEAEKQLIAQENTRTPNGYNVTIGGDGTLGHKLSLETRKKIGEAVRRRVISVETRLRQSAAQHAIWTPERRKAFSAYRRSMMATPEGMQQILRTVANRAVNQKWHENLSRSAANRRHSEETRKKIGEVQVGRTQSAETRAKRSMSLKNWNAERRRKLLLDALLSA